MCHISGDEVCIMYYVEYRITCVVYRVCRIFCYCMSYICYCMSYDITASPNKNVVYRMSYGVCHQSLYELRILNVVSYKSYIEYRMSYVVMVYLKYGKSQIYIYIVQYTQL